ncbi:MAG: 16S rRNA processing protein RimM [Anaerolineae bacterium]|nr:16S rRNA processing protein RimM [Anaerolineae bacterium]
MAPDPRQPANRPEAGRQPASQPAFLVLGRLLRPHGVRGEMLLQVITHYPERIADLETVFIGPDPYDRQTAIGFTVVRTRRHRGQLLITLKGIDTREDADTYRNQYLMVALDDAVPLEEDEYYLFQVLGARVVTTTGEDLGRVTDVLETGANDVFVVTGGLRGEVLIPDIADVVLEVDVENGRITVALLPGLLPD